MPARPLTDIQIRKIVLSSEKGDLNLDFLRASVIIGLVTETGIRASELVDLRSDEIDIARREVQIAPSKRSPFFHGYRLAPISDFLTKAIETYREHLGAPTLAVIPGRYSETLKTSVLHRIIAEAQLNVGLTAEACGFTSFYSDAPAYIYRDFRATAFAAWTECGFSGFPYGELSGWRHDPSERPKGFLPRSIPDSMARRFRERFERRYDRLAT